METTQINLRLSPELLQQLDQRCEGLGISRTNGLRLAVQMWLQGAPGAQSVTPVAPANVAATDQPARDALVALKGRVEALEQWKKDIEAGRAHLAEMERLKEEALAQQAEALKDDFAKQFGT